MIRQRPTMVTLTAILHLVFGIPLVLSGLLNFVLIFIPKWQAAMQPGIDVEKMNDFVSKRFPAFAAFSWAEAIVAIVTPLLLVLGGIFLLQMKNSGRSLSLLYVLISFLWYAISIYFCLTQIAPAMRDFFDAEIAALPPIGPGGPNQAEAQQRAQMQMNAFIRPYGQVANAFCCGIYPIYVLIVMLLPSVRLALSGSTLDPVPPPPVNQDDGWNRQ